MSQGPTARRVEPRQWARDREPRGPSGRPHFLGTPLALFISAVLLCVKAAMFPHSACSYKGLLPPEFPRIQGTRGTAQPRVGMYWTLKHELLRENRQTVCSGGETGVVHSF